MDTSFSIIIFVLDLFGTVVFAVTGALRAIDHRYDIVGIIILATVTGIIGGVMRDTILGIFPRYSFSDTIHIVLTTITAIIIFFFIIEQKNMKICSIFLRCRLGSFHFYRIFGRLLSNIVLIIISGLLTAFGGGILRDVFVSEPPIVFTKEVCSSNFHTCHYIPYIGKSKNII